MLILNIRSSYHYALMNNLVDPILNWSDSKARATALSFVSSGDALTYDELVQQTRTCARNLSKSGVGRASRIFVAAELGPQLFVLLLALFSLGAAAVLVERGFNRRQISACMGACTPHAIVGSKKVLWKLLFLPVTWRVRRINIDELFDNSATESHTTVSANDAELTALITFTSGSTGRPKGVNRIHRTLIAQHEALKQVFPANASEIHLTAFPVVSLHNLCSGFSTHIATLDDSPEKLCSVIEGLGVTSISGAPYFYENLNRCAKRKAVTFPGVSKTIVGGAPVEARLAKDMMKIFPNAGGTILYGSSEAEPIATLEFNDWIKLSSENEYLGYCVGRPVASVAAHIVCGNPDLNPDNAVHPGTIGEIIVSGSHVTETYFNNPDADRESKLRDREGRLWHRTGDLGFMDEHSRIWLVGRISNSIIYQGVTYYPLGIESMINKIAGVDRSALIKGRHGEPVLCVVSNKDNAENSVKEALTRRKISIETIRRISTLPLDARHRSKIDYSKLNEMSV